MSFSIEEFNNFFINVEKCAVDFFNKFGDNNFTEYLLNCLKYTAQGGKMMRAFLVCSSYFELIGRDPTENDKKIAYTLGWFIELIQASFLTLDDVMDNAETRRGEPCWYTLPGVGRNLAMSDSRVLFLFSFYYVETIRNLLPLSVFTEILKLTRSVSKFTTIGQYLDSLRKNYSFDLYFKITSLKTAHYTIYQPLYVGMIASQKFRFNDDMKQFESLTNLMGQYFQVQDDWIDVYGDPKVTGKVNNKDIEEGVNTWFLNKALELASDEQRKTILDLYGSKEKVHIVKDIYVSLDLDKHYHEFCIEIDKELIKQSTSLPDNYPKKTLDSFINTLRKRVF